LAEATGDRATVAKVNVDEHTAAAGRLGIRGIPTLIVFKDGAEVERFVGAQPLAALQRALDKHLAAPQPNPAD
jgi:thioredoxin-like negative regulator of GroEL